jgi:hypothetical protein
MKNKYRVWIGQKKEKKCIIVKAYSAKEAKINAKENGETHIGSAWRINI